MAHGTLWRNNDNDLLLNDLQIAETGVNSSGATITAQVKNGATVIAGATSITLAATTGASNDYIGVLSSTASLPTPGAIVKVVYTVTSSSGATGEFVKECRVRERSV